MKTVTQVCPWVFVVAVVYGDAILPCYTPTTQRTPFFGGLTFNFMGWIFQNMGLRVSRHWIRIPSWTNRRNGMSPKYFMESIKFLFFFSWLRYQILSNRVGGGPTFLSRGITHQLPKRSKAWTSFCGRPRNLRPGWVNVDDRRPLDRWTTDDPWGAESLCGEELVWLGFLKRHYMGAKWGGIIF